MSQLEENEVEPAVIEEQNYYKIRYECDLCDYKATHQGHLDIHKQSKHKCNIDDNDFIVEEIVPIIVPTETKI